MYTSKDASLCGAINRKIPIRSQDFLLKLALNGLFVLKKSGGYISIGEYLAYGKYPQNIRAGNIEPDKFELKRIYFPSLDANCVLHQYRIQCNIFDVDAIINFHLRNKINNAIMYKKFYDGLPNDFKADSFNNVIVIDPEFSDSEIYDEFNTLYVGSILEALAVAFQRREIVKLIGVNEQFDQLLPFSEKVIIYKSKTKICHFVHEDYSRKDDYANVSVYHVNQKRPLNIFLKEADIKEGNFVIKSTPSLQEQLEAVKNELEERNSVKAGDKVRVVNFLSHPDIKNIIRLYGFNKQMISECLTEIMQTKVYSQHWSLPIAYIGDILTVGHSTGLDTSNYVRVLVENGSTKIFPAYTIKKVHD